MAIMENEMRRIARPKLHADEMLDARAFANDFPRIEYFHNRFDREEVDLHSGHGHVDFCRRALWRARGA